MCIIKIRIYNLTQLANPGVVKYKGVRMNHQSLFNLIFKLTFHGLNGCSTKVNDKVDNEKKLYFYFIFKFLQLE